jgi:intein/homing endonuclease
MKITIAEAQNLFATILSFNKNEGCKQVGAKVRMANALNLDNLKAVLRPYELEKNKKFSELLGDAYEENTGRIDTVKLKNEVDNWQEKLSVAMAYDRELGEQICDVNICQVPLEAYNLESNSGLDSILLMNLKPTISDFEDLQKLVSGSPTADVVPIKQKKSK